MGFAARISKLGGVLRSALGAARRCCCGGCGCAGLGCPECEDGCYKSGDCCFSSSSRVRFTIEVVGCKYENKEDCEDSPPIYRLCVLHSDRGSEINYTDPTYGIETHCTQGWHHHYYVGPGGYHRWVPNPPSCEWVDPLTWSRWRDSHTFKYDGSTRHWHVELWGFEDPKFIVDLGVGDCSGLEMSEFIPVPGYECPDGDRAYYAGDGTYFFYKIRVKIEVIDNDDCMAV